MDTCICGISALQFWRTPPLVAALATGQGEGRAMRAFGSVDELLALVAESYAQTELGSNCLAHGRNWSAAGPQAKAIFNASLLLAPCLTTPIDVMARKRSQMHSSSLINPILWSGELPSGALVQIAEDLYVASPEFALFMAARTLSFERCLLSAMELCGTYSPYKAPRAIGSVLQRAARTRRIPNLNGWEPCFTADGGLAGLWSRPALATPDSLAHMVDQVEGARGSAMLRKVAANVIAGAASPFEGKAALMLGLPRSLGGMGFDGVKLNERVELSKDARALAGKSRCYCDLYWDDGLDVECQSALIHDNRQSFLSDSNRIAALSVMGVRVLPLTYDQLSNPRKFDAFATTVAKLREIKLRPKTDRQLRAANRLREELFQDSGE